MHVLVKSSAAAGVASEPNSRRSVAGSSPLHAIACTPRAEVHTPDGARRSPSYSLMADRLPPLPFEQFGDVLTVEQLATLDALAGLGVCGLLASGGLAAAAEALVPPQLEREIRGAVEPSLAEASGSPSSSTSRRYVI